MAEYPLILSRVAARRMSDEDLFERTANGDQVAFSEVYRRYHSRIYGYCLARSLDADAAADATQETFMRLLHAAPGSIDSPRAWLFTVARNASIDTLRRRRHIADTDGLDEGSEAWSRLTVRDTAEQVLARADGRNAFLALRALNPRYRTALILREVHGQSSVDMAQALGTTPGAVDTLVCRARDAFGAAYAEVAELPAACRNAVELIYRDLGSGITSEERAALDGHLETCGRCRREHRRASSPRNLAALLPFLVPRGNAASGLLGQAALAGHQIPPAALGGVAATAAGGASLAVKIAAGLAAAAVIAAPLAPRVVATLTDSHSAELATYRTEDSRLLSGGGSADGGSGAPATGDFGASGSQEASSGGVLAPDWAEQTRERRVDAGDGLATGSGEAPAPSGGGSTGTETPSAGGGTGSGDTPLPGDGPGTGTGGGGEPAAGPSDGTEPAGPGDQQDPSAGEQPADPGSEEPGAPPADPGEQPADPGAGEPTDPGQQPEDPGQQPEDPGDQPGPGNGSGAF